MGEELAVEAGSKHREEDTRWERAELVGSGGERQKRGI